MSRKHPEIRFVTVSPGATTGTDVANNASLMFKFLMRNSLGKTLGKLLGLTHDLQVGAKRYVDVVNNDQFKSGVFYASEDPRSAIGNLADQGQLTNVFYNTQYQDNARSALHKFTA